MLYLLIASESGTGGEVIARQERVSDLTPVGKVGRVGIVLFGSPMVFFGALHLLHGRGIARMVPQWIPCRLLCAYVTGMTLAIPGIALIGRRRVRLAAAMVCATIFSFVVLIHAPHMIRSVFHDPGGSTVLWAFNGSGGVNSALKDVALTASALMLVTIGSEYKNSRFTTSAIVSLVVFAAVMILFGVEHCFYTIFTPGIPSSAPITFRVPGQVFLSYTTGAMLLVGGAGTLTKRWRRNAGIMLSLVIVCATLLSFGFRLGCHQANMAAIISTAKDIAIGGGALIMADALPSGARGFWSSR